MANSTATSVEQHVRQLEQFVRTLAEVQARQIDRERNVPGSDPAEIQAIEIDLAVVHGVVRKLADG
ncbi:MAG TPA: hypothetical protein VGQ62_09490 [Chloroflexota bacterium]|jgi:hypothetical protein|nr:hypothetical protein [Chloroflexota bacterium]